MQSLRERVMELLAAWGEDPLTAVHIHYELTDSSVKLSSLSSLLKKMYDAGDLERIEKFGPRGGYGYRVKGIA